MIMEHFASNSTCRVVYWDGSAVVKINGATGIDVTVADNKVTGTITKGETVTTLTDFDLGDWTAYANTDGNYVLNSGVTKTYYFNDLDQIYGTAESTISNTVFVSFHGADAIKNGVATTPTYTDNAVSGYVDIYSISNSDYTIDGSSVYVWLAPKNVMGTEPQNVMANNLLSVLPLLVIVAILVGAIGLITTKRKD